MDNSMDDSEVRFPNFHYSNGQVTQLNPFTSTNLIIPKSRGGGYTQQLKERLKPKL
jgi:hypothetical protein